MNVKKGGGMYLRAIVFCIIFSVFGIYAMENENKTTPYNHQRDSTKKSPQMKKVNTLEDFKVEKDEFKYARRRSRSVESIDPLDNDFALLTLSSATLAIKELVPTNSIKKYRSMSDDQLKQSISKLQLPNLSPLTIKE